MLKWEYMRMEFHERGFVRNIFAGREGVAIEGYPVEDHHSTLEDLMFSQMWQLGQEGWELVGLAPGDGEVNLFFKRRVEG